MGCALADDIYHMPAGRMRGHDLTMYSSMARGVAHRQVLVQCRTEAATRI